VVATPPAAAPPVEAAAPAAVPTAAKTQHRKQARVAPKPQASNDLVDPETPASTSDDSAVPVSASSDAKPRNPVAKLGGFLKRINPLQSSSAAHKDDPKN